MILDKTLAVEIALCKVIVNVLWSYYLYVTAKEKLEIRKASAEGLITLILWYSYPQSLLLRFPAVCMKPQVWNIHLFSPVSKKSGSNTFFCHRFVWTTWIHILAPSAKRRNCDTAAERLNFFLTRRQHVRHCFFQCTREEKCIEKTFQSYNRANIHSSGEKLLGYRSHKYQSAAWRHW